MTETNNNPFKNKIEEEIKVEDITEESTAEETTDTNEAPVENNELQEKYDALNNQYLRLAADFDNYRKRQAQEREALLRYGTENALTKLVEVLDNFEHGEKALENVEDCQKCKESFNMVHKQVVDILTKLGLEAINAQGQEFDPNFHEAVMQTPTSEHPEHTIITELQKGYKMGDKVLRPSLVNVATAE
ncbi:nucleotide exchange factor GrpE [bacterium]|nr:nucleotide exchange factor GrpE [bacterium]